MASTTLSDDGISCDPSHISCKATTNILLNEILKEKVTLNYLKLNNFVQLKFDTFSLVTLSFCLVYFINFTTVF